MEQYRDLGITTDIGSAVDAMVHAFKSSRSGNVFDIIICCYFSIMA